MGLDVYLSERRIGTLSRAGKEGYSFAYAPELVDKLGEGAMALSRSLPVRAEPFGPEETRAYVEGLLPEGARRKKIAKQLGVDPADGYALIAELGRDCPGAVVFLPEGEAPQPRDADSLAWLSEEELKQLLAAPEEELYGPDSEHQVRFTLPGKRHKVALVRDEDGKRWALPEPGAPSTHILKPEGTDPPGLAVNEMACTTALRELGLPAAHTEVAKIAGRRCLVSRRVDRWGEGAGAERVHRETFCQARGFAPGSKETRRFGYRQSHELLKEIGEEDSIETLFAVAFCNHLVGNGDSVYGRGSALLYTSEGPVLAPCHGMTSSGVYEPPPPGPMARQRLTVFEMVRSATGVGGVAPSAIGGDPELQVRVVRALEIAARLDDALRSVADRARGEGWYKRLINRIPPHNTPFVSMFDDEDLFDF